MKFIPMSSDIKSSGFIIVSESVSSITSTKLSNMVLASIKIVCTYQFSIYIIIIDETTEKNSLFDGLSTFFIEDMLPFDLTSKFNDVNFE